MSPKRREPIKRGTYEIARHAGNLAVSGRVLGLFGIHEDKGWGYNLTHIPTGYAAITCMTKATAERALREFSESPVDWNFTSVRKAPKATKAWGKAAAQRYRGSK